MLDITYKIIQCIVGVITIIGAIYAVLPKTIKSRINRKYNQVGRYSLFILLIVVGYKAGEYLECKNYKEPYVNKLLEANNSLVKDKERITSFFADQLSYAYHHPSEINKIIIYKDVEYSGERLYLPIADYPDVTIMGFNDKISSIKMPENVELRLYKDINYGGESYPLERSIASFLVFDPSWNDAVSSIKIIKK